MINKETGFFVFCENIKWLRELHKLSREEMALLLGINENSMTLIERGMLPPQLPFSVLFQLQEHFEMTPEFVFSQLLCQENT